MTSNQCVIFEYKGKFAHFLRAEANASAPSYPFPSRTVLLGLAGAILGLSKDSPQSVLKDSNFAVMDKVETTHWHTANLRKDPPAPLPGKIKKNEKGSSKDQRNTIITQEWLFKPRFTVFAQLPKIFHEKFEYRLKNREWYFTPCLGLSEMMADITFVDSVQPKHLEKATHGVVTLIRKDHVEFNMDSILASNSIIKSIRMPRYVTENREFEHEDYLYEVQGKSLFVKTAGAYMAGGSIIAWL
ncbi:hypothetical protein DSCO28_26970 [Desulfosarcina ovata subsp. sediminis]|uniref:Type I-B CRISPR-associated protein Cas5 n=1 Tax=Desulfosarcina ovata subsp. sediminis TaxID=885957 RepID=A0A5K7ZM91_9BACT|nr:CRISPR-associated protein Cas5 [Desulfosarcina ovata]BBO82131.1 hypothetical protein DSCO28_26970 [Desulfosarcina ovata subsp. sediminis]